jgi:hypothetical protein
MLRSHLAIALAVSAIAPAALWADAFDNYTNPILGKVASSKAAMPIDKLTLELIAEHSRALPGANAAFVIVRTNDNRLAKLFVRQAAHKVSDAETLPIMFIERAVTFREGEERTVVASAHDLRLFGGFHLSLDIGQIVPAKLGGDLRFVVEGDKSWLEPVGKAKMYLVTEHLPEANSKKGTKVVVTEKFDPAYFIGAFKLYDDGRRSGTLHLQLTESGDVKGHFFSDKDGSKYDVEGKLGMPKHLITFTITYPRATQEYRGMLFTGDARAIAGTSRFLEREAGFYAVRVEE